MLRQGEAGRDRRRSTAEKHGIPYVIVRPGYVYGPGNEAHHRTASASARSACSCTSAAATPIPFTFVDNCADAIVLAGLDAGVDGHVFNVVDDDLPSSRRFLRLVQAAGAAASPRSMCRTRSATRSAALWEKILGLVRGAAAAGRINRRRWHAFWKKTRYSNEKVEDAARLDAAGADAEGLRRYFESCRREARPCLRSRSSAAARSRTPTRRRSGGSTGARSSASATASR